MLYSCLKYGYTGETGETQESHFWKALSYSLGAACDVSAPPHSHALQLCAFKQHERLCTMHCVEQEHILEMVTVHKSAVGTCGHVGSCTQKEMCHLNAAKGCTEDVNCSVEVTICRPLCNGCILSLAGFAICPLGDTAVCHTLFSHSFSPILACRLIPLVA